MIIPRISIEQSVSLEGSGLHSGEPVRLTFHPGTDGIWFRCGNERVKANPANVTDTTRCTRLGGISTVEHVMAAIAGLEITDLEVETSYPEMPGVDGSARPFVDLLLDSGRAPLSGDNASVEVPDLYRRLFFQEDSIKIAISRGDGAWRYEYIYGDRWPGTQTYELNGPDAFADDVAPARTFALLEEIGQITALGLGLGLDESSCLVLGPDAYKNEPRFPDEPARHKLLDLVGDLALAGMPIRALNVVAERSGHRTNVAAAAMLWQALNP
jgi:UDP-3-O-acyl-N-acetylglucosamine deacetylase